MEFHLANLDAFFDTLAAIPRDENVDCAIMQMPPNFLYLLSLSKEMSGKTGRSSLEQCLELILKMKESVKPFAMWRSSMDRQESESVELIESYRLPVFQSPERPVKALSA